VKVDEAALACIARLADGGMRDAQSILDQMIAFCGGEIAEADVLDVYGLVAEARSRSWPPPSRRATTAGSSRSSTSATRRGRDLVRLLADLQALVRAALLDSIAAGGAERPPRGR
jgi:DNA polymerase III subunit gamma/tau